ncbi:MAG: hypothetical protein IPL63_13455 [Saprospiraceae bacterium]|nr:hypothetical protein [Saprospiraceae bacterium]
MKDELSLMDEKIKSLDNDIKTSSEKIEDTRQQFVNSISILEEEIEEDLQLFQRITS